MAEKRKRALGVLVASTVILLLCGIGVAIAWPLVALRLAGPELIPSTPDAHAGSSVLSAGVSGVPDPATLPAAVVFGFGAATAHPTSTGPIDVARASNAAPLPGSAVLNQRSCWNGLRGPADAGPESTAVPATVSSPPSAPNTGRSGWAAVRRSGS